jgi:hypothetical protein
MNEEESICYGFLEYVHDEGRVILEPEFFDELPRIIKLDILSDWIYELQQTYEQVRQQEDD